jgi:hypothetical protein
MTLQVNLVNLGSYPNDGTGDDLRSAFIKSNQNFQSIADNVVLDATNLGTGTPIFVNKSGNTLQFRSIRSNNNNMAISFDSNELLLTVEDSINRLIEDTNPILGGTLNLNNFDIEGFGNINITGDIVANTVTANVIGQVSDIGNHVLSDLADVMTAIPQPGQALVWNGSTWSPADIELPEQLPSVTSIIAGNNISINPSNGVGDVTIEALIPTFDNYDFGLLSGARNAFDLIMQFTNIDFGAIGDPSNVTLDLGSIVPGQALYNLTSSSNTVTEGGEFTIYLTTVNVPSGTNVPYVITGVSSEDINGADLTGQFTVFGNFASITFTASVDELDETETFTITLSEVSPTISSSITILDNTDDVEEYTSGDIDGGSPATILFSNIADGGTPSTTIFTVIADGGVSNIIDGGEPSTTIFTETIEGGEPSSSPTEIYDGGIVN